MSEAVRDLRLPPHSIPAEQSLLGGLLQDNSKWPVIAPKIEAGDFYRREHRTIFTTISGLLSRGDPADIITTAEELEQEGTLQDIGGMAFLGQIVRDTVSTANIEYYAELVRERALRRRLIELSEGIRESADGQALGELLKKTREELGAVERLSGIEGPRLDHGQIPQHFNVRSLKPRPWVVENRLLQGYVTVNAAPSGCGKTAFEIASAVSVSTRRNLTGEAYRQQGRAWVYGNEEDTTEMYRRLGGVCILHGIDPDTLRDDLRLSSGYGRSLVIAKRIEATGDVVPTPVVDELIRALKDWQCLSFAVDPLISTHRANENSNTDLEAVMEQWRRVASETNCALEIPTHIPKLPGDSEAHAGNLNSIRGASSIAGAARQVVTLARMSKDTARVCGIDEAEARDLVRLDRAKGNYSPPAEGAVWLQMRGVCLDNDPEYPDWVGAFQSYPRELRRVEGVRDANKEERFSSLRVAIKLLNLRDGQKVPLVEVLDDILAHCQQSRAWVQENLSRALPKEGTAEGAKSEFTWSKDQGKTGRRYIHRALS